MLQPGDPAPSISARNQFGDAVDPAFADPSGHAETVLHDVRNEYVRGG